MYFQCREHLKRPESSDPGSKMAGKQSSGVRDHKDHWPDVYTFDRMQKGLRILFFGAGGFGGGGGGGCCGWHCRIPFSLGTSPIPCATQQYPIPSIRHRQPRTVADRCSSPHTKQQTRVQMLPLHTSGQPLFARMTSTVAPKEGGGSDRQQHPQYSSQMQTHVGGCNSMC